MKDLKHEITSDRLETLLLDAQVYVLQLFIGNSDGHDAAHSLRVYHNAERLTSLYPGADRTIILLSALLHDADDYKLFHTENNANARAFLTSHGIDNFLSDRICEIINGASFSKNRDRRPQTIEAAIVQDADRLDAIGAVGIARAYAYGGKCGRPLADTVAHFYEKLLRIRSLMNTPEAKRLADERHAYMESYLTQLRQEAPDLFEPEMHTQK